jgi:hypothetical protein
MKRLFSIALSLTIAAASLLLAAGRARAQTVEIKPCATQYDSYAVAGTTPINWLLMALRLAPLAPFSSPGAISAASH